MSGQPGPEAPDKAEQEEVERQIEIVSGGAVEFYGADELRERLVSCLRDESPLRVKLGLDPSSPDLHIGHSVALERLARFQALGHQPILLVGDFTARIGDPTGKKKTRPALTAEEVEANAATYVEQASRVLDVERVEVRFNSEWLQELRPADFVSLCSRYTVARLLERDDFAKRYAAEEPIAVHEFLYPLVQAYDSVALHADVELGGTDQTFNLLIGREIQRSYGQAPQAVITHPLLVGTDGRDKMSKSLGNSIGLTDAPEEVYGKVMSISDGLMLEYARLLSLGEWDELVHECERAASGEGEPMAAKQGLARAIVERLYDTESGAAAAEHFRRVVQRKEVPDEIDTIELPVGEGGELGLLEALERMGLTRSRGEARRLVSQGAVSVDGDRVADVGLHLAPGSYLIRVGKRRFASLQVSG